MRYKLPKGKTQYLPQAMAVLEALREEPLSHFERGRRHPIDIYATALRDVLSNLDDLLDLVDVGRQEQPYLPGNQPNDWSKKLIRQLDHAADSTVQFFDACRAIILCCFENNDKRMFNKVVRGFNTTVKPHTDRISTIVNLVKHNQGTLNLVYFHSPGVFVPGYFVEGVLEPEVIGPDPTVHPGANTAISLYREIPSFVCAIYFVSECMAKEVSAVTRVKPAEEYEVSEKLEEALLSVLKKSSLLPPEFFPDEIKMPVPFIRYFQKPGETSPVIELEMSSSRRKPRAPENCQVTAVWTVSSVGRTFKAPYMGLDHGAADT